MEAIDTKQARLELIKVRARFLRLQRLFVGAALEESGAPIAAAARANAPVKTGRLRDAIRVTRARRIRGRFTVYVTPARVGRSAKGLPMHGLFQEKGWRATGRATRANARSPRQIPGKNFLRNAGERNFRAAEQIYARRFFAGLREVQSAGVAAGIV